MSTSPVPMPKLPPGFACPPTITPALIESWSEVAITYADDIILESQRRRVLARFAEGLESPVADWPGAL